MTPERKDRTTLRFVTELLVVLVVFAVLFLGGLQTIRQYHALTGTLPEIDRLSSYKDEAAETTRIFSADGQLIGTLYDENRTWQSLDRISPAMVHALLAAEDQRFYRHDGVDPIGVARAAWRNWQSGSVEEGASTLTMQMARNLFLTREQSWQRKIREAMLAWRIEDRYAKKQILEIYLNQVYFGAGAHGIGAAASRYFGKPAAKLDAAEAALLAGVLRAPASLSPLVDRRASFERQVTVLQQMRDQGYLSAAQHRRAVAEARTMTFQPHRPEFLKYPYFTSYVIHELSQRYSEEQLYRGGLKIYTSVDLKLQRKAEEILRAEMEREGPSYNADNAALVLIESETGLIRAMVGGKGWADKNQFNRAWQANRQPGSAFKMFVYATALEQGYTPEQVVSDTPVTFSKNTAWAWSPANSDGAYMGPIPMWTALQHSRNVVAARLVNDVGPEKVVATARAMGLKGDIRPFLSLALGTSEATPLEMAEAASVFPMGGLHLSATSIKTVVDAKGRMLEDNRWRAPSRVLSNTTAAQMTEMLERVVTGGTGRAAAVPGYPIAGKTGTTESHRDAWFVGFSPSYSMAVWVGNDDFRPMWGTFGGTLPARIWSQVMGHALKGSKVKEMPVLARLKPQSVKLCSVTNLRAAPGCPGTYQASFRTTTVGTECTLHSGRGKNLDSFLAADPERKAAATMVKAPTAASALPAELPPLPTPDYPKAQR